MQTPLISVVMPAYNAAGTIRNAIGSIIDQTEKNWELIVIDDGSTDGTIGEVKKFDDPRIRLFGFENNGGIVASRNFGNEVAKGEWIAMQDADDFSLPNRFERCQYVMDIPANDVIMHGVYTNVYDEKHDRMQRMYSAPDFNGSLGKRILKEQFLSGVCLFRKSLWNKYPFRQETRHAFDWMMHIDWLMHDACYDSVPDGLYEYVRHTGSSSMRFEREGKRAESFDAIKRIIAEEYGTTR